MSILKYFRKTASAASRLKLISNLIGKLTNLLTSINLHLFFKKNFVLFQFASEYSRTPYICVVPHYKITNKFMYSLCLLFSIIWLRVNYLLFSFLVGGTSYIYSIDIDFSVSCLLYSYLHLYMNNSSLSLLSSWRTLYSLHNYNSANRVYI